MLSYVRIQTCSLCYSVDFIGDTTHLCKDICYIIALYNKPIQTKKEIEKFKCDNFLIWRFSSLYGMMKKFERVFEIQNYESAKLLYMLAHNIRTLKNVNKFFVNRNYVIRDYEWSNLEDWQKDVVSVEISKMYDYYKILVNKT